MTDRSKRQRARQALVEDAKHYRQIIEAAVEGICIVDRHNRITFLNRRFATMLRRAAETVLGMSVDDLVVPEDLGAARKTLDATSPRTARQRCRLRRADGTIIWVSVSTSRMFNDNGAYTGTVHMCTDITRQKKHEAARDQLALVTAQEAERRRIARELHDQMGQRLTVMSLGLKRVGAIDATHPELKELIERLQRLSETLSRDVHHLALELRPTALDDLGLSVAVANYADDLGHRYGIDVDVHCEEGPRLPPAAETTVYRIVQEALTNVAKHAKARHVSVILEPREDSLRVIVEDDGVGFEADRLLTFAPLEKRLGLAGMIERAALVGGNLQIESRPGHGTTLYLRVPTRTTEADRNEEVTSLARG